MFISAAPGPAAEEVVVGVGGDGYEEGEGVGVGKDVPRISGGGYYYSEKDGSLASAFVGGRRRTHAKRPPQIREEEATRKLLDPETGRVVAVGRDRVHFLPAIVKAKEWPFAEQLQGKSDFLRRLERVQIERKELGEEDADHQGGRRRRRRTRKKGKGVATGVEGEEEEEEWESFSEDGDAEDEGEGQEGEVPAAVSMLHSISQEGYFKPGWNKRDTETSGKKGEGEAQVVDKDGDIEMASSPTPAAR